jgi:hypothetical protein
MVGCVVRHTSRKTDRCIMHCSAWARHIPCSRTEPTAPTPMFLDLTDGLDCQWKRSYYLVWTKMSFQTMLSVLAAKRQPQRHRRPPTSASSVRHSSSAGRAVAATHAPSDESPAIMSRPPSRRQRLLCLREPPSSHLPDDRAATAAAPAQVRCTFGRTGGVSGRYNASTPSKQISRTVPPRRRSILRWREEEEVEEEDGSRPSSGI